MVIGGDMTGLMADDEGELGLVIHDAHQLAGDVDIAARHRESVLDCAIERREMVNLPGVGSPGKSSDTATNRFNIGCPGARLGTPEFFNHLRVLAGCFLNVARIEVCQPLLRLLRERGRDNRRGRGKQCERGTHETLHRQSRISEG